MALALLAAPVPGQVQRYSDSFAFLEAVRDRDGGKATALISTPGSRVINARERGNGEGALHYVARDRDMTWLAFLLSKGANPNLQSTRGDTPLTLATQIGWLEGVQLLLARGAKVDLATGQGETPLILAVRKGSLPLVQLLLAKGADPKRTDLAGLSALDHARRNSRAGAIVKLLEARAAAPSATKPTL